MNEVIVQDKQKAVTLRDTFNRADVVERFSQLLGNKNGRLYISSVLMAVAFTPDLQECTHESILKCALRSASLELSCDPNLHQAQLVPFNNRKTGRKEAQLIIHYLGLVNLAQRTGKYRVINYGPIREGMEIEKEPLSGLHTITGKDDGTSPVKGYFAYYRMINGFEKSEYMPLAEIHEHAKKFAPSYSSEYSKWKDPKFLPYLEQKTVIRKLMKSADMSGSAGQALAAALNDDVMNDEIDLGKEAPHELKRSKYSIVAELTGEKATNPDPVKDATWRQWEELAKRADTQSIPHTAVVRDATTDGDLQTYMKEIVPFVLDAEEQAAAA